MSSVLPTSALICNVTSSTCTPSISMLSKTLLKRFHSNKMYANMLIGSSFTVQQFEYFLKYTVIQNTIRFKNDHPVTCIENRFVWILLSLYLEKTVYSVPEWIHYIKFTTFQHLREIVLIQHRNFMRIIPKPYRLHLIRSLGMYMMNHLMECLECPKVGTVAELTLRKRLWEAVCCYVFLASLMDIKQEEYELLINYHMYPALETITQDHKHDGVKHMLSKESLFFARISLIRSHVASAFAALFIDDNMVHYRLAMQGQLQTFYQEDDFEDVKMRFMGKYMDEAAEEDMLRRIQELYSAYSFTTKIPSLSMEDKSTQTDEEEEEEQKHDKGTQTEPFREAQEQRQRWLQIDDLNMDLERVINKVQKIQQRLVHLAMNIYETEDYESELDIQTSEDEQEQHSQ